MDTMDYDKLLYLVYQVKTFVYVDADLSVSFKTPYDFVTSVDLRISKYLKKELKKAFPDVGFVTEEEAKHNFKDKTFILDPIDGTTNLIHNYKMSSISLAYVENGEVKFGTVFNPFTREFFFAIRGKGAHYFRTYEGITRLLNIGLNNYRWNKLAVTKNTLNKSIIEFGANPSFKDEAAETFARAQRVFENALDIRRVCSAALSICYVAAGRLDGYFEKFVKPWDHAAASLILEEAGGKITQWNGEKMPLDRDSSIVCSNAVIHDELKSLVNQ